MGEKGEIDMIDFSTNDDDNNEYTHYSTNDDEYTDYSTNENNEENNEEESVDNEEANVKFDRLNKRKVKYSIQLNENKFNKDYCIKYPDFEMKSNNPNNIKRQPNCFKLLNTHDEYYCYVKPLDISQQNKKLKDYCDKNNINDNNYYINEYMLVKYELMKFKDNDTHETYYKYKATDDEIGSNKYEPKDEYEDRINSNKYIYSNNNKDYKCVKLGSTNSDFQSISEAKCMQNKTYRYDENKDKYIETTNYEKNCKIGCFDDSNNIKTKLTFIRGGKNSEDDDELIWKPVTR